MFNALFVNVYVINYFFYKSIVMALEPEIIPSNSKDGEDAQTLSPKWKKPIFFVPLLFLFIYILKTIFTSILIFLGLYFIWNLATKKIN